MNGFATLSRPIKRIYRLVLSQFKTKWTLNNYPIEYRQQEMLDLSDTNLTMFPWEARIINWYWMNGDGHSKKEAYIKLKEKFDVYKSEGHELPRPGTKVQIKFASVSRIDNFDIEAVQFFKDIFEMDYNGMFISDESSMYDFCWTDDSLLEKQERIKEIYNIDIKEIKGLEIVGILERIREGTGIT
ncbi:hypothetical protein B1748_17415 [Paenibacillus sp. MY03]|uniref:hypothetical protein n=1 Tax=Paenibacillus sp. MY03 TaxID=302980 RepID=UPI000B3CB7F7|nr:hypothetical protein [Paenibacillus sp. MY03]OUS75271.1 hypothetical protein B1748_17415 [Paenibacillus sp. MY03]